MLRCGNAANELRIYLSQHAKAIAKIDDASYCLDAAVVHTSRLFGWVLDKG
ncbi:MAG: hypothetical protein Q9M22_05395 [Mariprofundaceae bacterium]|nr:hypothetical protein [Mariprofundaceae bacterium]